MTTLPCGCTVEYRDRKAPDTVGKCQYAEHFLHCRHPVYRSSHQQMFCRHHANYARLRRYIKPQTPDESDARRYGA